MRTHVRPLSATPFLLQRILSRVDSWHIDFRKLGLSVLSVRVMATMAINQGRASVAGLEVATAIDQSTLSHILRRLERDGHLEKARDTNDNRAIQIRLTARGAALAKRCYETACKHERRLTRGLGVKERRALKQTLDHLYRNVSDA
jgi:MarR family transcriptional regulator, organic hydroperoxide resistance regulator